MASKKLVNLTFFSLFHLNLYEPPLCSRALERNIKIVLCSGLLLFLFSCLDPSSSNLSMPGSSPYAHLQLVISMEWSLWNLSKKKKKKKEKRKRKETNPIEVASTWSHHWPQSLLSTSFTVFNVLVTIWNLLIHLFITFPFSVYI